MAQKEIQHETDSAVKKLKEELFLKKSHGGEVLGDKEMQAVENFSVSYKEFLNSAKTERECINFAVKKAKLQGFEEFDKHKKYGAGDKVFLVNKDKLMVLAVIGKNGMQNGNRMAIGHVDVPRIDLKPTPLIEKSELAMFKTRYYGGIKRYQWPAIPLALHGKVIKKDGTHVDIRIGEDDDDPCFCITDLLPHLAHEQMSKKLSEAVLGENLNVLVGSMPFKGENKDVKEGSELVKLNVMRILNEKYGMIESDFISAEFQLVPAFKARDVGFDRSLIGGYGHDDRCCSYSVLEAILECNMPESTAVVVLCDKEETGSDGNTGMKSAFLKNFIADLANMENLKARDVLSKSKCLSTDVNAAFDPTFASEYDEANSCHINKGVVFCKYSGGRGKSGTSDASAEFMGEIRQILNNSGVLWQSGELGKVDSGGGGTIAKYVANLNVDVVDLGIAVLSMHAPFEIISKIDLYMLNKAAKAFFGG